MGQYRRRLLEERRVRDGWRRLKQACLSVVRDAMDMDAGEVLGMLRGMVEGARMALGRLREIYEKEVREALSRLPRERVIVVPSDPCREGMYPVGPWAIASW